MSPRCSNLSTKVDLIRLHMQSNLQQAIEGKQCSEKVLRHTYSNSDMAYQLEPTKGIWHVNICMKTTGSYARDSVPCNGFASTNRTAPWCPSLRCFLFLVIQYVYATKLFPFDHLCWAQVVGIEVWGAWENLGIVHCVHYPGHNIRLHWRGRYLIWTMSNCTI
jgi:hypothetical protein